MARAPRTEEQKAAAKKRRQEKAARARAVSREPGRVVESAFVELEQQVADLNGQLGIAAQSLGFLRSHLDSVLQRYLANKVETQQLSFDDAARLLAGERAQVEQRLQQIAGQG